MGWETSYLDNRVDISPNHWDENFKIEYLKVFVPVVRRYINSIVKITSLPYHFLTYWRKLAKIPCTDYRDTTHKLIISNYFLHSKVHFSKHVTPTHRYLINKNTLKIFIYKS